MAVVARLTGSGTFLSYGYDETVLTKFSVSGDGTASATEFDENTASTLSGTQRMSSTSTGNLIVLDSINEIDPIETVVPTTGLQLNIDPATSTKVETLPVGQSSFTTAGSFTFTVPNGVTSISAVVVGGGGGGAGCDGNQVRGETNNGGGGGGLAYGTIAVTPGEILNITVGNGGNAGGDDGNGGAGGNTTIVRSGTTLLSGGGGAGGRHRSQGFTSAGGTSGGTLRIGGGSGGNSGTGSNNSGACGAGGAGGYSGNGGNGGNFNTGGGAGSGGGAGGGGGFGGSNDTLRAGGGGGVGIKGTGSNGSAGVINGGGGGGGSSLGSVTEGTSGGGNASGLGGTYGGGGGGKADAFSSGGTATPNGGAGTGGAVRIIWGSGRSYPSTSVADATVVNYALTLSDLSGNGRTASSVNGANWVSSNSGVVAYNGINHYMTNSAYKGITGTGARTSIIWFKARVPNIAYRLFGWGTTAAGGKWNISLDATTFRPVVEIATGSVLANTSAPNVTDGKWYMIAASAPASGTANNIKLYINGDLITDTTITSGATAINTISGSDVSHGASLVDASPGYLNGHTSQFLIYNTQLTDFEMKQIYRTILNRF